jgi:hypothetical protein
MRSKLIPTETGRLDELIAVVSKDREFVVEAMGCGPSGPSSRDKTLCADGPRFDKFAQRAKDLSDVLAVLKSLR